MQRYDVLTNFADRLAESVKQRATPVLVGLDPRLERLPAALLPPSERPSSDAVAQAFYEFCVEIIDVVSPLAPAVKPQAAFFEEYGPAGMRALAKVIQYARQRELLVILDGKRNDIGSTATAYAKGYLGADSPWKADALTVSPYLGDDSLSPFVEVAKERDAGVFVLVKTSNPGGRLWQDLSAGGQTLFRHVAEHVETLAKATLGKAALGAVGAVVGATYPEQLAELREAMPHTWFLVPGFGSQGGTAKDVAGAFRQDGLGAIVNNSRGIIFAHQRPEYREFGEENWQRAVEAATKDMIEQLRNETAAGKLA